MKPILALLTLISTFSFALSQSAGALLEEARELEAAYKEGEALQLYLKVLEQDPNNMEGLTGASFLSSRQGFRQSDEAEEERLYHQGLELAEQALELDSNHAEANYVMGIAMGRIAEISPTKKKIQSSKDVKKYAERTIQLNRKHAGAWHLLGKWHYGVKDLDITKRFIINLVYGGMPRATFESAVDCYTKAINYRPDYILYRLDLAKAYIKLKQEDDAIAVLEQALKMQPVIPDDPEYLEECQSLLDELK